MGRSGPAQGLYSHHLAGRRPPRYGRYRTEDSGPAWGGGDREKPQERSGQTSATETPLLSCPRHSSGIQFGLEGIPPLSRCPMKGASIPPGHLSPGEQWQRTREEVTRLQWGLPVKTLGPHPQHLQEAWVERTAGVSAGVPSKLPRGPRPSWPPCSPADGLFDRPLLQVDEVVQSGGALVIIHLWKKCPV